MYSSDDVESSLMKLNNQVSDAVHSYVKDGYKIDANKSIINPVKDKNCVFKAVLNKDVDGIKCEATITLEETKTDNSYSCTYNNVEMVGDTVWSKESKTYSSSISRHGHVDDNESSKKSFIDQLNKDKKLDESHKNNATKCNIDEKIAKSFIKHSYPMFERLDDYIKVNDSSHDCCEDEEDDLIKLVKYIFNYANK